VERAAFEWANAAAYFNWRASVEFGAKGESACCRRNVGFERETAVGEAGEAMPIMPRTIRCGSRCGRFRLRARLARPNWRAAFFVGGGEILLREGFAGAEEFEDGFAESVPVVQASSTPEP